jgi:hypothetical protein
MLDLVTSALSTILDPPEWILQQRAIAKGEATWDDFSFEQRTCKGWLIPYLSDLDAYFSGRWAYWTDALLDNAVPSAPIPRIDFLQHPEPRANANLQACLQYYNRYDFSLSDFLEWILWGFGEGEERPRISAEANEFLYRTFNLGLLLKYPHDYFGSILCEAKAGYWSNPNAFYPTSHCVCQAMAEMQMHNAAKDADELKTKSVLDPCVGTGRMLMYASNYSLFLHGMDIDRTCVNACKINGYLYMPWLVRAGLKRPDGEQGGGLVQGNTLTEPIVKAKAVPALPMPEPLAVVESAAKPEPGKMHQLTLF